MKELWTVIYPLQWFSLVFDFQYKCCHGCFSSSPSPSVSLTLSPTLPLPSLSLPTSLPLSLSLPLCLPLSLPLSPSLLPSLPVIMLMSCRRFGDWWYGHLWHHAVPEVPRGHLVCGPGLQYGGIPAGCRSPWHEVLSSSFSYHDSPASRTCFGE